MSEGRVVEARAHAEQAVAIGKLHQGAYQYLTGAMSELGEILQAQADFESARREFQDALQIQQKVGALELAAETQVELASLALDEEHPEKADTLLRSSIAEFEKEKGDPAASGTYTALLSAKHTRSAAMARRRKQTAARDTYTAMVTWVAVAFLISALACNSKPKSSAEKTPAAAASGQNRPGPSQASADPGIDLNCVYSRLQNPPESFHYVYKKTVSDGSKVDQEADVTPQAIEGFRGQPDGSPQALHAVRSDSQSWQAALAGLTGISGMSGTVSTFNHNSAMQRESDGSEVNGYQTIHYSIDTARWDATTRQMLGNFALGPGGFDKGDAWVMTDGCPVKLTLDEEMHKKDGSLLESIHYEETMVKK